MSADQFVKAAMVLGVFALFGAVAEWSGSRYCHFGGAIAGGAALYFETVLLLAVAVAADLPEVKRAIGGEDDI